MIVVAIARSTPAKKSALRRGWAACGKTHALGFLAWRPKKGLKRSKCSDAIEPSRGYRSWLRPGCEMPNGIEAGEIAIVDEAPAAAPIEAETSAASTVERDWQLATPTFAVPLLVIAGALLYFLNLGGYPLYTKGEPREAVTVFDIVHGGGVILPLRAGVEIPSKPLLMHWIAALVSLVIGVNAWSVRLPSALFGLGGMLITYGYVRRLFNQRAGLIAAIVTGTTFQYLQSATGARVDMTLTFFMAVALFEFIAIAERLSERTILLYLALAFAVLTKGPIGAALPVLIGVSWITVYRRWELISRLHLIRGAIIVGVIGGGWYIAAIATGGMAFVHKQILAENLYRLIPQNAVHLGHEHPFYYEDLALLGGFMPWTPLAIIAALKLLRNRPMIDSRVGYLIVWCAAVLVFYNFAQSKRGVYLLALYPALAATVAIVVVNEAQQGEWLTRWNNFIARGFAAAFILAGAVATCALVILLASPSTIEALLTLSGINLPALTPQLRAEVGRWIPLTPILPIVVWGAGAYLSRRRGSVGRLIGSIAIATGAITLAVNLVISPAIARLLALDGFAARVRQIAGTNPVGYFGNLDYGFAFYNGRDLTVSSPIDPDSPDLLVSPEDDWKLTGPKISARYAVLLRSNPTELDGSGRLLLLFRISPPAPANRAPGIGTKRLDI
jgi:4-amino-4-deoxy-L-arabinose transferase-like glycosyltransferase